MDGMDPVSVTIVTALAAGAAAGLKKVASAAVSDAYAALKNAIAKHHRTATPLVAAVEANPDSKSDQAALSRHLVDGNRSDEVRSAAERLLDALVQLHNEPAAQAMFDFNKLRAAKNFELSDIEVTGTLLRADEATFEGDFKATGIRQATSSKK
jgi:hypothetical protein